MPTLTPEEIAAEEAAIVEAAKVTIAASTTVKNYPDTIEAMTLTELQDAIEAQILASEELYKAIFNVHKATHGPSVMVLMPGENLPRLIAQPELASVTAEHSAAAEALTSLGSALPGEVVVIAQGQNFQMKSFVYEWTS